MIPIRQLLNRIRWDKEFASGSFEIGYDDHVKRKIIRIPFNTIQFEEGDRFSFQLVDRDGIQSTIPFHRIREVYRDGVLIWQRTGR